MYQTYGYAAQDAGSPLAPFEFQRRDLRELDVRIDVLYCGVCHSDLHQARNEWRNTMFPVVPGHEIVGRVAEVGTGVTKFKAGQLVGVGCLVDSCRTCASCGEGLEQYCENGFVGTYNGNDRVSGEVTYGGYSTQLVVDEAFVLRVPENLDAAAAAPLLCAGITTYSPLRTWGAGPGKKVGIVGLGGLGHMGVKLAHAMGAHVVLFTTSPSKIEDGKRLGADEVVISKDPEQMKAHLNSFDLIVNTVAAQHDLNPFIELLKRDGTLTLVGAPEHDHPSPQVFNLIFKRRRLAGSLIGGIAETQEMLDFCGQHGITSDIEMINMQDINDAYERMLKSDVKYRFVIDLDSLRK
ncbi:MULTISPECIES: NAD(P)-dependent alcohol dehydrogenase [Paraburkholderia]|jgi:alcohol dehydrogenase (NADP+)|uniref:Zinc-type alcohol dehydrogenase-like protein n=1 Tax=Paraburkholderia tropica TaxID=92647 RepID=A0A1A5XFY4_9BURK|nr:MULTISPECIES: NAD(P)-dependent alcohol dehydrogenase [Paraburkholderia]MBB2982093.1 putative zinc-type alcohol dehydrogenase-like protein [Paraburkholderia tropica]MBB3003055.1 putative zinc-type alcohol dehydrogenase-like protein [Paraburkholderia tropica]MBB6322092.1 putative zinc-type alcohol dehydrogenase-like protein [Paraburkholderia tropica]MBN3812130.1 NAD(P)-dependent alcohol dehydrogenase [Paraburkholderia sp. Ac-20347]MDE1138108.1 NAD(P)-dependent alcohol dehydrogenase [Paraburkh